MTVLRDLLLDSRDGEWGKGEAFDGSVEMKVIRGTDFENARLGLTEHVPNRHLATRHASRKTLRNWDILIETAGGSKDRPTGRTLLLTPQRLARFDRPVTCASFARFLRIDPRKADPSYVFWLLQDMYARRELLQFHTQHTGVARFQFTTFADTWPLRLPDLTMQRQAAKVLSAYDELIENNARRTVFLEDLVRRLFEECFIKPIGKLPLPGDGLGDWMLPDGWQIQPLGAVAAVTMGQSPPSTEYTTERVGLPFHQGVTEFEGYFHATKLFCKGPERYRRAEAGDILFSVRAPVGRIAIALDSLVLGRGLSAIRAKKTDQSYLLVHLRSQFSKLDMFGGGTIFKSITKDDLANVPILIGPAKDRARFEVVAEASWSLIKNLHITNTNLRETRDLLLPRLISGEIEVGTAKQQLEAVAA